MVCFPGIEVAYTNSDLKVFVLVFREEKECVMYRLYLHVFSFNIQNNPTEGCPMSLISQMRDLRPKDTRHFPCSRK